MKETIERERSTTAAVKQLRNEVRDERQEHEEKVWDPTTSLSILTN
jgi:IQ domain-containing protein G